MRVVTATAEHGKQRVALGSFQGASPHADRRFSCARSSARLHCERREFGNRQNHASRRLMKTSSHYHVMATISAMKRPSRAAGL